MMIVEKGCLRVKDLRLKAVLGILPHERREPQSLEVQAELEVELRRASHVDHEMTSGVNYAEFSEFVSTGLVQGQFGLIEDALVQLAEQAFERFPDLLGLKLAIAKPDILPEAQVEAEGHFRRSRA